MLDLNLGGITSAGKPLPEGDYEFSIQDMTLKPSSKGDSNNLGIRLEVISENEQGRGHFENLNIQQKTLPFVKAFLSALWGMEDDEIDNVNFDVDESDGTVRSINGLAPAGSTIGGTIKHVTTDDGRTYGNVVSWFTT